MTPLSSNPTVVLHVSTDGTAVLRSANNIAPNLNIVLVTSKEAFNDEAANQPFNSMLPPQPVQVMSSKASKARYAKA
jgi:hypothetical protein